MKNTLKPQLTGLSCVIRYINICCMRGGEGGPSPVAFEAVGTKEFYCNILWVTPVPLFKILRYIARYFSDVLWSRACRVEFIIEY